jgi:RND family efflux transporter MFP subunit
MTRWSFIFALPLLACGGPEAATPVASTSVTMAAEARSDLVPLEPLRHAPRVEMSGDLAPDRMALVGFALGGTLEDLVVRRGARVREGDPLGDLDDDVARATLDQARAGLAAAEAQLRLGQDGYDTTKDLQAQGAAAASSLRQSTATLDLVTAQRDAASAQLRQAEVALGLHHLRAPLAGLVTRAPDGPGIGIQAGMPVFVVEDTDPLVLHASVAPEEARGLQDGLAARVVPEGGTPRDDARVRLVLGSADPQNHRIPVEIEVPNPDGLLVAHAFARASVTLPEQDALGVPASALVQADGSYALWAAGADGLALRVPVRVLHLEGDRAILDAASVPPGLRAIARPRHDLLPAQRVAAAEAP